MLPEPIGTRIRPVFDQHIGKAVDSGRWSIPVLNPGLHESTNVQALRSAAMGRCGHFRYADDLKFTDRTSARMAERNLVPRCPMVMPDANKTEQDRPRTLQPACRP